MKCFVDNIEAWSANEITINWNGPLAWLAAFVDEQAQALASPSTKPAKNETTTTPAGHKK